MTDYTRTTTTTSNWTPEWVAEEFPCMTELAAGEHGTPAEQAEARRLIDELIATRPLAQMGVRARDCRAPEAYQVVTSSGWSLYYSEHVLHYIRTGEMVG